MIHGLQNYYHIINMRCAIAWSLRSRLEWVFAALAAEILITVLEYIHKIYNIGLLNLNIYSNTICAKTLIGLLNVNIHQHHLCKKIQTLDYNLITS